MFANNQSNIFLTFFVLDAADISSDAIKSAAKAVGSINEAGLFLKSVFLSQHYSNKALMMNILSPSFDWSHILCMKHNYILFSEGLLFASVISSTNRIIIASFILKFFW